MRKILLVLYDVFIFIVAVIVIVIVSELVTTRLERMRIESKINAMHSELVEKKVLGINRKNDPFEMPGMGLEYERWKK